MQHNSSEAYNKVKLIISNKKSQYQNMSISKR